MDEQPRYPEFEDVVGTYLDSDIMHERELREAINAARAPVRRAVPAGVRALDE